MSSDCFASTCTAVLIGIVAQLDFHTMTLSIGYYRDRAYFTTANVCPYPTSAILSSIFHSYISAMSH